MGRKSIWNTTPPAGPAGDQAQSWEAAEQQQAAPKSVVEQLRVAAEKQRDRSWERANQSFLIRGVAPKLTAAVKEIAGDLNVKTDDVARAFFEFALECYRKGEVELTPVLEQRLTLFPKTEKGWPGKGQPGWVEKVWDFQPPVRSSRKGSSSKTSGKEKAWRCQVAYRGIPDEVKTALRQLHIQYSVPLGEVATAMLGHALDAYQAGRLVLIPQPGVTSSLAYHNR
ncbi:MAG: hypothetical protein ACOYYS_08770 [Chloroflexota bacterium]